MYEIFRLTNGNRTISAFCASFARTSQNSVDFLTVLLYIRTSLPPRRRVKERVVRVYCVASVGEVG